MSYSQKIKTLLKSLKKTNKNININISRNNALINEENYLNNCKKISFKKYKNKYKTSIDNGNQEIIIDHIQLYEDKNDINNEINKFNNNFIIETSYHNNSKNNNKKPNISNKKLDTSKSCKNNYNVIKTENKKKYSSNNNSKIIERKILFSKNKSNNKVNDNNIYLNYKKIKNLNNSDDEVYNKQFKKSVNIKYFSSVNSSKKKLSAYILKNSNNDIQVNTNNSSSFNFSSYIKKKKYLSNPKLNKGNYITNINSTNSGYKNITSRIIKRHPIKSLTELFNEENNYDNNNTNVNNKSKHKCLKQKLLMIDKGVNSDDYNNHNSKKMIKFKNKNYNSTSDVRERDNHSGGKIILALNVNSSKKKAKKKIKTYIYYVIIIQSMWRGYIFRKLIKITRELFLLFHPFINHITKTFNRYKKIYFTYFRNKIKKCFINNPINYKIASYNNSIKKNKILCNKNNNIKRHKFIKKNTNITALVNKNLNLKKNKNNNEMTILGKKNDIKKLKINNIFYHKKKLSMNNKEINKNIILTYSNKKEINDSNISNINFNHFPSRRMIKRTSYKRFNNVSPDYRNIELNINNNSLKNSLIEQSNNLNNYSSSVSIFFQTQFPDIKKYPLKNLVYISKNKKPKNNIKFEILEKIKSKIFNNFYLTLSKCFKKAIYKYYWNQFLLYLKENQAFILRKEKISHLLKNIILESDKKIKKNYFRKYRDNILIEKIKIKLFYLTDYQFSKSNKKYLKSLNINNKSKKIFDLYVKYRERKMIKYYFLIWKMNNYYNFLKIQLPMSSTRDNNPKKNLQGYIKKMINYNINDTKDTNNKERRQLIYVKNNSYLKKKERSPIKKIKKSVTQGQLYANNYNSSSNNCTVLKKYNKKIIINKNIKINNMNHYSNDLYYNDNKLSSLNKICEKINTKNLLYKCFNLWKTKLNNKKKMNNKNNKQTYCKTKFLKYFLVSLIFIDKNKKKIDNKTKIGKTMFIWYKNAFKYNK